MEDYRISTTSYMNGVYGNENDKKQDASVFASSSVKQPAVKSDIQKASVKPVSKSSSEGIKLDISAEGKRAAALVKDGNVKVKTDSVKSASVSVKSSAPVTVKSEPVKSEPEITKAKSEPVKAEPIKAELKADTVSIKAEAADQAVAEIKNAEVNDSQVEKITSRRAGVEDFSLDDSNKTENTASEKRKVVVAEKEESDAKAKIAELRADDEKRSERIAQLRDEQEARSQKLAEIREEMNKDSEPAPVTSFAGYTKAQIETLYHQGRISYQTYQSKVEEKEAVAKEQMESLSDTSGDVVGLEGIKNQLLYGMPDQVKLDIA